MDDIPHQETTHKILGAAFAVHNALGPGFVESVYEKTLRLQLEQEGISYREQVSVPIYYLSQVVGIHRLDMIVEEKVVVELKAVSEIADIHKAVVRSYLAAANLKVGLIVTLRSREYNIAGSSGRGEARSICMGGVSCEVGF